MDYWGEPTEAPDWRQPMTDRLDMPGDGKWPDAEHLGHYEPEHRTTVSTVEPTMVVWL